MFKINKIFLLAPLALLFFATAYTSMPLIHAQTNGTSDYIVLAPLPNTTKSCSDDPTHPTQCTTDLGTYVKGAFALLIGVAAVLAVIMIVIGGIQYMSTDAISGKSDGKEKITQALYGLLLAIACWLILYTINPNILNFDILNSPDIPNAPSTHSGSFAKVNSCQMDDGSGTVRIAAVLSSYPFTIGDDTSRNAAKQACRSSQPVPGLHGPPSNIPNCTDEIISCIDTTTLRP